jgi:hypothetical protein
MTEEEPAELQEAIEQVRLALDGGWEPTETDQRALGEVLWTLSSYVDLSGEFNAYCYEIWQHGLEVMTDVAIIHRSVREVFDAALAADLTDPIRQLVTAAAPWEPRPHSNDESPWRKLGWSLVKSEFMPPG